MDDRFLCLNDRILRLHRLNRPDDDDDDDDPPSPPSGSVEHESSDDEPSPLFLRPPPPPSLLLLLLRHLLQPPPLLLLLLQLLLLLLPLSVLPLLLLLDQKPVFTMARPINKTESHADGGRIPRTTPWCARPRRERNCGVVLRERLRRRRAQAQPRRGGFLVTGQTIASKRQGRAMPRVSRSLSIRVKARLFFKNASSPENCFSRGRKYFLKSNNARFHVQTALPVRLTVSRAENRNQCVVTESDGRFGN